MDDSVVGTLHHFLEVHQESHLFSHPSTKVAAPVLRILHPTKQAKRGGAEIMLPVESRGCGAHQRAQHCLDALP